MARPSGAAGLLHVHRVLRSAQPLMPAYHERFPVGSRVRVASRERLDQFIRTWRFYNPLTAQQLPFAGRETTVRQVGFYHGGDALYTLDNIPGVWHEPCILDAEAKGAV